MRITYVVHQFLPRYFTGTEQYCLAIAERMAARGHDVDVFALEPDFAQHNPLWAFDDEPVGDLPVRRLRVWMHLDRDYARMEFDHPFVAEKFREHIESRQPDVVHFFHLRHLGAGLPDVCHSFGIRTVVHLMDFWFLCPAVTLLKPDGSLCDGPPEGGLGCVSCVRSDIASELDKRDLRQALAKTAPLIEGGAARHTPVRAALDLTERPKVLARALESMSTVVAPSHFLRQVFLNNGIDGSKIRVATYGVNLDRVASKERPPRNASEPLRCGFIGSIAHHKGTDVAIDAVLASIAPMTLDIFGRTSDFPDFAEGLVQRADERIRFPGPFEREELARVLGSIDVLLVPSRWYENTPFVVLEAFGSGVPVFASDLGGMSELVKNEVNGELFATGDAGDLTRRLDRLAEEPERLQRYRDALPDVKSIDDNALEIEAMYSE